VPFDLAPAPTGQHLEPLVEARGELARVDRRRTRGRELDGERDPV